MENQILLAARSEQQELEKSISILDAEYAAYEKKRKAFSLRLDAVKALRSAYGDANVTTIPKDSTELLSALAQFSGLVSKSITARGNSLKARALSAAVEILKGGSVLKTQQLVERIEQQGIELTARDKVANLSVLLSKDHRFVSDRRFGWSLAKENPQDAPTSAGSFAADAANK